MTDSLAALIAQVQALTDEARGAVGSPSIGQMVPDLCDAADAAAAALKDALPIMRELRRLLWDEDLHWKLHPTDDEIDEAEAVAKQLAAFLERHKEET